MISMLLDPLLKFHLSPSFPFRSYETKYRYLSIIKNCSLSSLVKKAVFFWYTEFLQSLNDHIEKGSAETLP